MAATTSDPLLWANISFFAVCIIVFVLLRRVPTSGEQPGDGSLGFILNRLKAAYIRSGNSEDDPALASSNLENPIRFDAPERPLGDGKWDWLFLAACLIFGGWLFFATLDYSNGSFEFAVKSWSDFGANLSLSQSFALGHNYPTEHPFFPGEAIRYHFLFWFQAANLSYLGLNLVWGVNLLSLISLASLLVLIITFAELLFNSRAVGRIAAALFFFASSSLAFIPFLLSQSSVAAAINSVLNLKDFVRSGYPFRGDDWGGLTVAVFSNQRHLISSAGILLIVIIYLIGFYRRKGSFVPVHNSDTLQSPTEVDGFAEANLSKAKPSFADFRREAPALLFCGILIGLMPYWNSAVFLSAAIILGSLLVLFPFRRYLIVMIGTVILFGLPQILMLRSGNLAPAGDSFFQWGYTIPNPTLWIVLGYLGWTFGVRWLFLLVAVIFVPSAHRRLLVALLSLVFVVFLFQLSTDAFNNHKLLNIWTILSSVYVAYALWLIGRRGILRRSLAIVLSIVLTLGAVIDLFPLHNDGFVAVPYENDRLTEWLLNNTQPGDIFLTDTLLSHPILFTGRKIFLGNTLFAWTAGYELRDRESTYQRMLMERDPAMLLDLMHRNNISFVAIDDGLRSNKSINGLNEAVIRKYFEKVYEDDEHRQGNITIYKVPPSATGGQ
ncbi:MAG: hypothetical protein ABIV48_11405, partial [Pyrinomonadaceae bacterium]